MQWAQAALARNPHLEVLTADRDARVFTVRDRRSAFTTEVQLADIAAAPVEFLNQPNAVPSTAPAEPAAAPSANPEPDMVTRVASSEPAEQLPAPESHSSPSYTIDRSGGQTKVTGAGISVVYGEGESTARTASVPVVGSASNGGSYTIDRSSGLVRINGPGVSIESRGTPRAASEIEADSTGAEIEPVICEGPRVMQLDSRTLRVEGDALTARGGCQLYITNSTIVASGTGVVIRDATVHINNSRIEGGLASFDAKEQAKVFLRGSTLNGLSRRNERAVVQDQGGNSYQ
jgi:hypothetical protein